MTRWKLVKAPIRDVVGPFFILVLVVVALGCFVPKGSVGVR